MDFKSFLPKEDNPGEGYWALVLEPGWVQAGIWTSQEGNAKVVNISPPAAWSNDEELIDACDTVLSASAQSLPEGIKEPSKTVFGVPGYWVKEGQIQEEYLGKIKTICSNLSLTPVGFVVLAEAISHFEKSQEGSPLTAIVLGLSPEIIEVTLFRLGNLAGSTTVARSVSVVDDLVEGLTRFATEEPFPSRLILFDGKEGELEDIEQMLNQASWDSYEKIKFLHTPKIEIIEPENKILATALAGGLELANVSKVSYEKPASQENVPSEAGEVENVVEADAAKMGFVVGEDVRKVSGQILETEKLAQEAPPVSANYTPEAFSQKETETPKGKKVLGGLLSKVFIFASKFRITKKPVEASRPTKNIFIVGMIVLLILAVAGFLAWWYLPKATVTIYVSPQRLDESSDIEVKVGATSVDTQAKTLPGKVVNKEVSGEKTMDTTGTKVVGDRAKGEVVIYRSGPEMTLAKATVIKSSGGIAFSLDDEVTIASGSASTPGTSKVKITASDIGANYNLDANENFTIANYPTSDLEAKNETAFGGGSSREISAVSQEDQDKLLADLSDELKRKAQDEVEGSISGGEYLIKESWKAEVKNKTFSAKVGDEASSFKLSLSLTGSFVLVLKDDLLTLAKDQLKGGVASGFALRDDQIKVSFEFIEVSDGNYKLKANFSANLLPQINPDDVAKKIAGKYPSLAEEYLSSIEGYDKARITMNPNFSGKLGTLPRVAKNITIEVQSSE